MKESLLLLGLYRYSKTEKKLVACYLYDWHSISKPRISYTKNVCLQSIILSMKEGKDHGVCVKEICVYCHGYLVTGICTHINPSCRQVGWCCKRVACPCLHIGEEGVVKIPVYPSVWVCSSETTKLADLCDLVGHNPFGLKAMSLLTSVRWSIEEKPVHVNKGCRIRTSEASSLSKGETSPHWHENEFCQTFMRHP